MITRFEAIEHTADKGILAYGDTPARVLESAALGMFSIMTDLELVRPRETIEVRVTAQDREALLVEWLQELLSRSQAANLLLARFRITRLEEAALEARAWGEAIDPSRHTLKVEIKAATYHRLVFAPGADGWMARVIFDV
ncbi:MAG: archease [Candidatus Geothermincolia bacterium]